MKALVLSKSGSVTDNLHIEKDVPKPSPKKDEVLVKIVAVALNPIDAKMAKAGMLIKSYPHILGCDFSGVVEAVGPDVTDYKVGDEVFGYTGLGNPGTFAEYCIAGVEFVGRKPAKMSFEEAATISVGCFTAALGVIHNLLGGKTKVDTSKGPEHLLVWGGTSVVGSFAVQLGKACGFTVISTASAKNMEVPKKLGAAHVIDYNAKDAVDQIKKITNGKLKYAFDCVGPASATHCAESLTTSEPAALACVAGKPTVTPNNVTVHGIFFGGSYNNPGDRAFFKSFIPKELEPLLGKGQVVSAVPEVLPNGLGGIVKGLEMLDKNQVSAKKLVVKISETP
jgi:NADPH:quinone reductase-like Zn-dependent oxidoreductase